MSVKFDDTGEALKLNSGVLSYNAAYTLAAWVCPQLVNNQWRMIMQINRNNELDNADFATISNTNTWLAYASVGGASTAQNAGTVTQGTWYHIALVRSSATDLRLYVDGTQVPSTVTRNVSSRSAATDMRMGSSPWGDQSDHINGRIAAVKIWTAALTQNEIAQEMQTIRPQRFANLYSWLPLLTHTDIADYSGNGHSWTAEGTLSTEDNPPVSWGA